MNKTWILLAASFCLGGSGGAQTLNSTIATAKQDTDYQIIQRDGSSQVWQRTEYETTPDGKQIPHVHQYTEISSGLNHLVNGQWVASSEEIDVLSDGSGAVATNGQHQVYFPADIYQGEIRVMMSNGKALRSRPIGLSYDNGKSTVLIGMLTNSVGELLSSNEVLYPDAFVGIKADLVYVYTKSGLEQNVVIRAQPAAPEDFNMDSKNTTLQMMTEFFDAPRVTATMRTLPAQAGMTLNDESLDFGTMKMVRGKAFLVGEEARADKTLVAKSWVNVGGRQILVEAVPVMALADELLKLPVANQLAFGVRRRVGALKGGDVSPQSMTERERQFLIGEAPVMALADELLQLPLNPLAKAGQVNPITWVGRASPRAVGGSSGASPHRKDSILDVVSSKRLLPASRPVAVEAGRVKPKLAFRNPKSKIEHGLVLDYVTVNGNYEDITFLSNHTYYISGYTSCEGGDATVIEGGAVLKFARGAGLDLFTPLVCDTTPYNTATLTAKDDNSVGETISGSTGSPTGTYADYAIGLETGNNPNPLQNLRVLYADDGVIPCGGEPDVVRNCQFFNDTVGIVEVDSGLRVENVLMTNVGTAFQAYSGATNNAAFITAHHVNTLNSSGHLSITNSLFVCVTNWGTTFTGAFNVTNGSDSGVFQTYNGNGHYLPSSSPYIDAGNVTADAAGLYYYTTQTNQTMEGISTVDLGYHYPALNGSGNPVDSDGDGIADYLEDSDGDGLPDSWETNYFGNLSQTGSALDGNANTLLYDYTNALDPNVISFSIQATNPYVNVTNEPVQLDVYYGTPFYKAVLVDNTNFAGASWSAYTSSNITVNLGSNQGAHDVWVGLKGLPSGATPVWYETSYILDTIAPTLTITNPTTTNVYQMLISVQGYANEALSALSYDISNATGIMTNQLAAVTGESGNTNYFVCPDLFLTNGLNLVTIHASDLAGNVTNKAVTFNETNDVNAPVLRVDWPTNNAVVSGSNFTLQAQVDDPAATVSASANGTNIAGIIEAGGKVWVNNLPLNSGTNAVTIVAANGAGLSTNSLKVVKSSITVTMNALTTNQLNQTSVDVTGTIGASGYDVWVNGVQASVDGSNWEADGVPVSAGGTAGFDIEVYPEGTTITPVTSQRVFKPQPVAVVLASLYSLTYDAHIVSWDGDFVWERSIISWVDNWGGMEFDSAVAEQEDDTTAFIAGNEHIPPQNEGGMSDVVWEYADLDDSEFVFNSTLSQVKIEPAGQTPAGVNAVYYEVKVAAMEFTNEEDSLDLFHEGDTPLPPDWLAVQGQRLVNTGEVNNNGATWGATVVSGPAGWPVYVTPQMLSFHYNPAMTVQMKAQEVHLAIVDGSGTDLTLQTNTVIVGQQMNLRCQFSISNQPLSGFSWTVPGFAISNYVANSTSGIVYTNFALNRSNVVFYWVDGGVKQVRCTVVVAGAPISATATFNVVRPLPQFSAQTVGAITADTNYHNFTYNSANGNITDEGLKGGTWLHYGVVSSWANAGIVFTYTNAPVLPPSTPYGRYFLVQIINNGDIKKNALNGTNLFGMEIAPYGLDTDCPYQSSGDFWHLGGYSYLPSDKWFDAPGSLLDDTTWLSRTNSFAMYLMFQPPDYTNTISVPMFSVTWSWSGIAKTNGSLNGYYLFSSSLPPPIVSETLSFPTWTTNSSNFKYQSNSIPFNEN